MPDATRNSWSRWRSAFSPSLARKSVKRERKFPCNVLGDDGDTVGFRIGLGEKLLLAELRDGALGQALVSAKSAENLVKILRANVGHTIHLPPHLASF